MEGVDERELEEELAASRDRFLARVSRFPGM